MVVAGTAFLIIALYVIGNKRNLFGSTFSISARFRNVNGLMAGNNVRLSGIDVGTVESIEIISDTSVLVVMNIENKVQPYIRNNAVASVGTDGLMGNKLVNINATKGEAPLIKQGDVLATLKPFETDEMLRTLNTTNVNLKTITNDLKEISGRINGTNLFWRIMLDTLVAENVKEIIANLNTFTQRSNRVADDVHGILHKVGGGEGTMSVLLNDTTLSEEIKTSVSKFKTAASEISQTSQNLRDFTDSVVSGRGLVGQMVNDTSLSNQVKDAIQQVGNGAKGFSENMEALKHSIFFRKYFRKQEKEKKKANSR